MVFDNKQNCKIEDIFKMIRIPYKIKVASWSHDIYKIKINAHMRAMKKIDEMFLS